MKSTEQKTKFLADYAECDFAIDNVEIYANVESAQTTIKTTLTITPKSTRPAPTPLHLDGQELALDTIRLDGVEMPADSFEVSATGLTIHEPPTKRFSLETTVTLSPDRNTSLMGLYRSNGTWCTQCEPEGFRRITYYLDRPDVMAPFQVRMEASKSEAPVLLANGNLVDSGDLPGGRHFAVWHDPHPKPSYLFAMVAGDLGGVRDQFTTMSGRTVELGIYCEHGKQDRCTFAMGALKRSMTWDEQRFGREYDLDIFNIVAVSDFNFGAMENKGLNIFNDKAILARPETATDGDFASIERIIAHEYFHNWTGNRITCRDWFQLCLKEGLTVYRDQEFSSDMRSRAVKRIQDVKGLRAAQFPEDGGPLAHAPRPDRYEEINNFYTATVYQKGAEVVRMLATLLGEKEFAAGLDLYFNRHDGEATTIEAFLKAFADSSGKDLSQFALWYTQAGTPEVNVSDHWDETEKTYTLSLSQTTAPTPGQSTKSDLVIPVKFGLLTPNGDSATYESVTGGKIDGDMIVFDTDKAELKFKGMGNRPIPSLFRGFSAPVRVKHPTSLDEQLFLGAHDNDPFNRWQALQNAATSLLIASVKAGGRIADVSALNQLGDAYANVLNDGALDDDFKAQALSGPGEQTIAQEIGENIDPDLIHKVQKAHAMHLSTRLDTILQKTYNALAAKTLPYSLDTASAAARSLRLHCLGRLVSGGSDQAANLASAHYRGADNMTDRFFALASAVYGKTIDAESLLLDFRDRYADDTLVRDKYFALAASTPSADCLAQVQAIYSGGTFPRENPNRVRALIGSFAMANPTRFAAPDGSGFNFVADVCKLTDPINAQLAARLLTAFSSWRKFEPTRRAAAKSALETLSAAPELSKNLRDILNRTLAE